MRARVAIGFAIAGDLRFLSHRDSLRLFERALTRALLPVRYSQGFNPKARIWLLLARPVGVAGEDELLIVELAELLQPDLVRDRLAEQMPEGITLGEAYATHETRLPQPTRVSYRMTISADERDVVLQAADRIGQAESYCVTRNLHKGRKAQQIDIRPHLEAITVADDMTLHVTMSMTQLRGVRPGEMLSALEFGPERLADLCRHGILWETANADQPQRSSQQESENGETNIEQTDEQS